MSSTTTSTILCPACSKANEPDSRFCRYCGASLAAAPTENGATGDEASVDGAPDATSEFTDNHGIEAHAPLITPLHLAPAPQADATGGADEEALSSPAEIDARRARQLLDKSLYLSERGDAAGAILACRQSVALAPTAPGGYSMLGLLLERTGNLARAIAAYEKAVELAPGSTMERESIERLREKLNSQKGNALFHFDDADLFGADALPKPLKSETELGHAVETPSEEAPHLNISAAAPGLPASYGTESAIAVPEPEPVKTPAKLTLAQSIAAQLPAIARSSTPTPIIAERRTGDRRMHSVPVMTERRLSTDRREATATGSAYGGSKARGNVAPIFMNDLEPTPRSWDKMWQRPSYFGRSLPLAGATVLCLGFLLWARSFAVARAVNNPVIAAAPTGEVSAPPNDPTAPNVQSPDAGRFGAPPAMSPVGGAQGGGFPISNRPLGTAEQVPAPNASNAGSPVAPRPVAPSTGTSSQRPNTQRRTTPSFPRSIAPAPIPSNGTNSSGSGGSRPASPSGSGGSVPGLTAPNIGSQESAPPPVSVLPPGSSATALNPAGASGRGYVRITQGRIGVSRLPQRAASQAGADEREAADAVRNGQTDRAIERLNSAVDNDSGDSGFRFQQRAMLFLDRGDYSRAADDFQSAIAAYGEQISRGDQVAAARAGQRAARNGLNLALAGKSR